MLNFPKLPRLNGKTSKYVVEASVSDDKDLFLSAVGSFKYGTDRATARLVSRSGNPDHVELKLLNFLKLHGGAAYALVYIGRTDPLSRTGLAHWKKEAGKWSGYLTQMGEDLVAGKR